MPALLKYQQFEKSESNTTKLKTSKRQYVDVYNNKKE